LGQPVLMLGFVFKSPQLAAVQADRWGRLDLVINAEGMQRGTSGNRKGACDRAGFCKRSLPTAKTLFAFPFSTLPGCRLAVGCDLHPAAKQWHKKLSALARALIKEKVNKKKKRLKLARG